MQIPFKTPCPDSGVKTHFNIYVECYSLTVYGCTLQELVYSKFLLEKMSHLCSDVLIIKSNGLKEQFDILGDTLI